MERTLAEGPTKESGPGRNPSVLRVWTHPIHLFAALVSVAISPFLLLGKVHQWMRRRRAREFALSRWTIPDPTPELSAVRRAKHGPHVVFACVSYGEAATARPVARLLAELRPDVSISFSLFDPISLNAVKAAGWGYALTAMPFEFLYPMAKWLSRNRPDLIVFVERVSNKMLAGAATNYGAEMILINGNPRRRDKPLHRLGRPWDRWNLRGISGAYLRRPQWPEGGLEAFPQSAHVEFVGDLKSDLASISGEAKNRDSLDPWLAQASGRPLIVAGSTETSDEERFVLEAYRLVRDQVDCRLVLAPRNLKRLDDTLEFIAELGLSLSRRTAQGADADVYVLDTLGELAYVYGKGVVSYVGGFYDRSGHNVLEPLRWGVPFTTGSRHGYFDNVVRPCIDAGIGARAADSTELARAWLQFLRSPLDRGEVERLASEIARPHFGSLRRTAEAISRHLGGAQGPASNEPEEADLEPVAAEKSA